MGRTPEAAPRAARAGAVDGDGDAAGGRELRCPARADSIALALMMGSLSLPLAACTQVEEFESTYSPTTVEPIKGRDDDVQRVTFTAEAARRADLKTATVRTSGRHTSIPYAALIYDEEGATFTYVSPKPLVFVREPIDVDARRRRPRRAARRPAGRHDGRHDRRARGVQRRVRSRRMTSSGVMRWIVASSLRFRWLVLFAAIALLIAGAAQIRSAQVDVFPEFAPPRVEIQTLATGNSSSQVEELITIPLEEQLNGIEGLEELRSKSIADLSAIELIFKRGTNEVRARQLVQERIAAVTPSLPTFAAPPFMMPAVSAASRVMKIGLTSDKVSPIELSTIAYWKIRQRLLRVPGVANVAIWGERLQQEHIQVDPKKLARNGVTLDEVMNATSDSLDSGLLRFSDGAFIGKGGFVETGGVAVQRAQQDRHRQARRPRHDRHRAARRQAPARLRRRDPQGGAPAARRRRRRQQRPRPAARRPEVSGREHAGAHEGPRGGDGRDAPRPARREDRHDDLPAGDVHRDGDPQPHDDAAARLPARRR